MPDIDSHQERIREAVLRLLCYAAVFHLTLTEDDILRLIHIRVAPIPLHRAISGLVSCKKLTKYGNRYGLPRLRYPNPHNHVAHSDALCRRVAKFVRVLHFMPFIKSVVVVDEAAMGNADATSTPSMLLVVRPARIYITRALVAIIASISSLLAGNRDYAHTINIRMIITTNGINFNKDTFAVCSPHTPYWLMFARPVFGKEVWTTLLHRQAKLGEVFPNASWPKDDFSIYGKGFIVFDKLDAFWYRRFLRSTTGLARKKGAFVRIRPDVLSIREPDNSAKIAIEFDRICKRYGIDTTR